MPVEAKEGSLLVWAIKSNWEQKAINQEQNNFLYSPPPCTGWPGGSKMVPPIKSKTTSCTYLHPTQGGGMYIYRKIEINTSIYSLF